MRAYSQHDEESLRDQGLLRGWIASGFLTADQNSALQAELNVPLRRTHGVLRAVLFLFTALIVAAAVGLLGDLFDAHSFATSLVLFASSAAISLVLAWLLATRTRLYRCGVEEALAAAGVVLLMLAVGWEGWKFQHVLSTATGALASFGVYRVFRFRYAVVASVFFAGMIPFALPFAAQTQPVIVRTSSLLIFAISFFFGGAIHRRHRGEILEDDCTAIKATAFGGMYFVLNLVISSRWGGFAAVSSGWFYWFSYALMWIVPAVALWLSVRQKDRAMMNASAIAALITLLTNKSYLQWERQTWDPILLGVFLIAIAMGVRRWLTSKGSRHGFTSERLVENDDRALTLAAAASMGIPGQQPAEISATETMRTHGGQSGGGGASGSF
jgi:hypothetical protein